MSRVGQWLALCALSQVTVLAVVAASIARGPAGMNLEAALFAILLVGGALLLFTPSRASVQVACAIRPLPSGSCTSQIVLLTVLALPIAAIDAWLLSSRVALSISGKPYTWLALASVLIVGPIMEEIIYRGLLWRALRRRSASTTTTLCLSTAAFGLYHLAYWEWRIDTESLTHVVSATVGGLAFGMLRHWSGGVALPVIIHAGANSLLIWVRVLLSS